MLEVINRRCLDQKNLIDLIQFLHGSGHDLVQKNTEPTTGIDLDWNQWWPNKREDSCREAKILLNPDGRQLGRKFPLMEKERLAYCLSKLRALRVIPHTALWVKASFAIRGREKLKIHITADWNNISRQKKKKKEKKKVIWFLQQKGGKQI